MLAGGVYEVLGTCRIGGAQQGAEFYRDRPAKTDHVVSLVLDVPRKVHRRSELGRCNTDQGLGLMCPETNIKIPDAAKTDPVGDSDHPADLGDAGDRMLVEHTIRVEHNGGGRCPSKDLAHPCFDPVLHEFTRTKSRSWAPGRVNPDSPARRATAW